MLWRKSTPEDISESISLNYQPQSNASGELEQLKSEPCQPSQPKQSKPRGLLVTCIFQVFCFLWIPFILTFIVLNFLQHIVGATIWCLGRHCHVELFNPVTSIPIANLDHFDKRDHDVLVALQLFAKVAEIWFGFIVASLVSLIVFRLAERPKGLPIGLITRPFEFADLLSLFEISLWRTTKFLVCFTAFLCIICNLMGPAVAVLLIPHLRWIDTEDVGDRTFDSIGAADPPVEMLGRYFWDSTSDCHSQDFNDLLFSCAASPYASKLDSWIGTYIAADSHVDGLTQEWNVKFRVNQTFAASSPHFAEGQEHSATTWWTPSRQLLSSLDDDLAMVKRISQGADATALDEVYADTIGNHSLIDPPDSYHRYNDTLRLNIERNGPILGAIVQMHWAFDEFSIWTTTIDDQRSIRCFLEYDLFFAPFYLDSSQGTYTKCVRIGTGWSKENKHVNFTIAGERNYTTNLTSPHVEVSITSSDKAQFFEHGKFPSWLPPECLSPGQLPSTLFCDWERLFHTDPNAELHNRTQNVVTIGMSIKDQHADKSKDEFFQLTVDFVAFLNFTSYQLDASPLTNPTILATTQELPLYGTSIHVDPAWMLAAWTVDNHGVLLPDRAATIETVRTLNRFRTVDVEDTKQFDLLSDRLDYLSLLPVVQALSLIDFTTKAHGSVKAARQAAKKSSQPHLTRRAHIFVWAYGLDSRTAKIGVTVGIIGIIIVLIQVVLGFVDRRRPGGLTQLLMTALEHVPEGEFKGVGAKENSVARTRFCVQETTEGAGGRIFKRV